MIKVKTGTNASQGIGFIGVKTGANTLSAISEGYVVVDNNGTKVLRAFYTSQVTTGDLDLSIYEDSGTIHCTINYTGPYTVMWSLYAEDASGNSTYGNGDQITAADCPYTIEETIADDHALYTFSAYVTNGEQDSETITMTYDTGRA